MEGLAGGAELEFVGKVVEVGAAADGEPDLGVVGIFSLQMGREEWRGPVCCWTTVLELVLGDQV